MDPLNISDARVIYITTEGYEEARKIGRALVEQRLAACVNILGPMTSMFRWEGDIRESAETVLIAKTTVENVDALTKRVIALHSYDCPCVVAMPIESGNPAFLEWIAGETAR